jgi:hypothetical protein
MSTYEADDDTELGEPDDDDLEIDLESFDDDESE